MYRNRRPNYRLLFTFLSFLYTFLLTSNDTYALSRDTSLIKYSEEFRFIDDFIVNHSSQGQRKVRNFLLSIKDRMDQGASRRDKLIFYCDLAAFSPHRNKDKELAPNAFPYIIHVLNHCEEEDSILIAYIYDVSSNIYKSLGAMFAAQTTLEKSISIYKNLKVSNLPYPYLYASIYFNNNNYNKAIPFYKEEYIRATPKYKPSSLNNIGLCFLKLNQFDSSRYYFNRGIVEILKDTSSNYSKYIYGLIHGSLANQALRQGDSLLALQLLEVNFNHIKYIITDPENTHIIDGLLNLYLKYKQYDKIPKVIQFLNQKMPPPKSYNLSPYIRCLNSISLYYALTQNIDMVQKIRLKIWTTSKLIAKNRRTKYIQSSTLLAQSMYMSSKQAIQLKEDKIDSIQREQASFKIQIVVLLTVVVFVALLLIVYFRKRASIKEQEKILKERENELIRRELIQKDFEQKKLEENIELKQQDLTHLSLGIGRKDDTLKNIYQQLEELMLHPTWGKNRDLRSLLRNIEVQIENAQKLEITKEYVEEINSNFFKILKQHFPNLSENDLKLCAMIRMGYDSKEIANIKNIAVDSVRKSKTRLRKKIDLDKGKDLREFIKTLIPE